MTIDASATYCPECTDDQASLRLEADLVSAKDARRLAREVCHDFRQDVLETVELLVSEVVTNAIVHARTHLHLRIRPLGGHRVLVEVRDHRDCSNGQPVSSDVDPEQVAGRGLALVGALASDWGYQHRADGGKIVWFQAEPPQAEA